MADAFALSASRRPIASAMSSSVGAKPLRDAAAGRHSRSRFPPHYHVGDEECLRRELGRVRVETRLQLCEQK